ncbi:MAG: hypothetical protein MUD15_13585 [Desulfobacterota bacterium]|jgi:hypothetical protein|nr:hypothetical protein [Thermodesulfobacteriota bacterium]
MDMTCHKCGYRDAYTEFTYLCKNGCPACGESDLRRCPRCGAECVFFRSEALEDEEGQMRELSYRLSAISRAGGREELKEARRIISRLSEMNLRWNSKGLREFLLDKQRELFF